MKKKLRPLATIAMIFSLFIATLSFTTNVSAEEIVLDSEGNVVPEEEIDELAAQLEFLHDEATIFDENGNFVGFDIDKVEEKYGHDLGLSEILINASKISPVVNPGMISIQSAAVDRCINNKIKATYGDVLTIGAVTSAIDYMYQREFKKAATSLVRIGVRGNVFTIAATLTVYFFQCLPLRA